MKKITKIILSIMATVAITSSALAGNLKIKIYNPGTKAIFPITSTIIYGDKDAVLIDAQFQKQYALELIKEIKTLGKDLKFIYISHSDPDYYFGLDEIKKAFPKSEIVSTAQTAYLIEASKDGKLQVWGSQLKGDAPSEIIIPKAIKTLPNLEGNKLEIVQTPTDPAHSFVWIPSLKTIVGGISVSIGSHLWMADTKDNAAIEQWIAQIEKMKWLHPKSVVPSHFAAFDESPKVLDFVENYLKDYNEATKTSNNAAAITEKMEAKYPQLPAKESLELGAKVFKGEMAWELKSPYPAIGRKVEVNFGAMQFVLDYKDNKTMSFSGTGNAKDTVQYTAVEVAQNVFMVYWSEPILKAMVTHIQDYNKGIVYTNIAYPNGEFLHLNGTLKILN